MAIKERTVKAHVAQILAKLDLESRLQAGLVAFAWAMLMRSCGVPDFPPLPPGRHAHNAANPPTP